MSRSARREAIVKLRDEIAAARDPRLIARLTTTLTRLLKVKPVKSTKSSHTNGGGSSESTHIPNGSALDKLPVGEQTFNRVVIAAEDEDRRRGSTGLSKMTDVEWGNFLEGTLKRFSESERESLEAYCAASEGSCEGSV